MIASIHESSITMEECVICVDTANPKKRIVCQKCCQIFCLPCCKRFVLERIEPQCPGCFLPWNRQMLIKFFGKPFVKKEYKEKREKDLFETEKAFLPEAQRIWKHQNIQSQLMSADYPIRRKVREILEVLDGKRTFLLSDQIGIVTDAFEGALDAWNCLFQNPTERGKETFKCTTISRGEQCRGFVQSGSCGICETKFCHACRCRAMPDHECDQDAVKTVKLLKKDSKECPKCFAPIFKIDGCDQMWCTLCRTAFSWQTREIVTGRIHNPHYYDYLRTRGPVPREPEDEARCNEGLPHPDRVAPGLKDYHRLIVHCQEVVRPTQLALEDDVSKVNLRIKFLSGVVDETSFKRIIQKRAKKDEFRTELRTVLNTFIVVGTDIIRASMGVDDQARFDKEMNELISHCNECFSDVGSAFEMVFPKIDNFTVKFTK